MRAADDVFSDDDREFESNRSANASPVRHKNSKGDNSSDELGDSDEGSDGEIEFSDKKKTVKTGAKSSVSAGTTVDTQYWDLIFRENQHLLDKAVSIKQQQHEQHRSRNDKTDKDRRRKDSAGGDGRSSNGLKGKSKMVPVSRSVELMSLRSPWDTTVYMTVIKTSNKRVNQLDTSGETSDSSLNQRRLANLTISDDSFGTSEDNLFDSKIAGTGNRPLPSPPRRSRDKSRSHQHKSRSRSRDRRSWSRYHSRSRSRHGRSRQRSHSRSRSRTSRSRYGSSSRSRSCSRHREWYKQDEQRKREHEKRERQDELVQKAEDAKAEIVKPSGKTVKERGMTIDHKFNYQLCDKKFSHFASHLDVALINKIENGEFVELEKPLPKEKSYSTAEDHRMELTTKDAHGPTFFVPVKDREVTAITSFRKWDKALRVYSGVYSKANPTGANELVQYVSSIETAAESFLWDHVYQYDQIFCHLKAEFPRRS